MTVNSAAVSELEALLAGLGREGDELEEKIKAIKETLQLLKDPSTRNADDQEYDAEKLAGLWDLPYKSLAMAPGTGLKLADREERVRLREARFILEAKIADQTRFMAWMTFGTAVFAMFAAIGSAVAALVPFRTLLMPGQ
jgi:hypothetical protein